MLCTDLQQINHLRKADPDGDKYKKTFSFHPSKESTDIGTEKPKKFRQREWGSNPVPLVMRTSALTAELSCRSQVKRDD